MTVPRFEFAQSLAVRRMHDTGKVLTRTGGGRDAYGYKGATYPPGPSIICSFDSSNTREVSISTTQTVTTVATVYVPLGTAVKPSDRFQLTHRNGNGTPETGQPLSRPITYQVIGEPEVQPTMIALQLTNIVDTGGGGD